MEERRRERLRTTEDALPVRGTSRFPDSIRTSMWVIVQKFKACPRLS